MSSTASSLPVHGTLPRQNKSTLGPEKPSFKFFESFLLLELVCTYDKLNIYAKNISCHGLIKIIIYGTEKDREKGNKSYLKKINQRVRISIRMKLSISWWLLQLTVIILAIWRITVNSVLKISFIYLKKLIINFLCSKPHLRPTVLRSIQGYTKSRYTK